MSAANDMTSGQAAQRPGSDGGAFAAARAIERAKLARQIHERERDRKVIDDESDRNRPDFETENASDEEASTRHGGAKVHARARKQCFDVIMAARAAVKQGGRQSAKTETDYTAKSTRLLAVVAQLPGSESSRWKDVLRAYAPKRNSFFANRAAAMWCLRERLDRLLAAQCRMQRHGADAPAWISAVGKIEECLATYGAIESVNRQDLLEASNSKPVKVASKRNGLHKFVKGWRTFMVKRSENRIHGEAIWLMSVTGCRPQELLAGVHVRMKPDHATVRIAGAKIGSQAGQPWRELDVSYRNMPMSLLQKREGVDVVVRISSTAGLRKSVASIGRALWPKLLGNVTPYHFRHALTEDLREAGWPAAEIGGALGHRVSDTSTYYGRRRRGGQGGVCEEPTILRGGVRTALPVRASAPFDPRLIPGRKGPAP